MLIGEMNALVYDFPLSRNGSQSAIIDAGANIGVFARWAFLRGAGRIICFEPSPLNAECLRRNLKEEISLGRATVVEQGLWDMTTKLSFSSGNSKNPGTHHIAQEGSGDSIVQVAALDEIWPQLGLGQLDAIKMDVEGAERRALAGARATIEKFRPFLCIVTEHTDDMFANTEAVVQEIAALGLGYRYRVTEAHPAVSPSRGRMLTPYSLLFSPERRLNAACG